jgi:hypothetical protein
MPYSSRDARPPLAPSSAPIYHLVLQYTTIAQLHRPRNPRIILLGVSTAIVVCSRPLCRRRRIIAEAIASGTGREGIMVRVLHFFLPLSSFVLPPSYPPAHPPLRSLSNPDFIHRPAPLVPTSFVPFTYCLKRKVFGSR